MIRRPLSCTCRLGLAAVLCLLALAAPAAQAQERQRIAVLPFNPVGVPRSAADSLHADLQAGLAATDVYFVIPEEQQRLLLAGEGYGDFGCTDEPGAYELGTQLHAGQVVLGELGYDRGLYVLDLRVLDIPTDRVVYLDRVSSSSLPDLRETMEMAAFRMAGLVVNRRGRPEKARERAQILVETAPPKAEVSVNGVWRGISPALLSGVPLGRITISARLGNLYGEKVIDTTAEVLEVRMDLLQTTGGLQIAAPEDLDVYLDGQWLGKVRNGPFRYLAAGIYLLELKGPELYWQEYVQVPGNRIAVVEAAPRAYGTIEYGIPEGAAAEIQGPRFRQAVRGYGQLPAPSGDYLVTVAGPRYETQERIPLSVPTGGSVTLTPQLDLSRASEYARFDEALREGERTVAFGYRPSSRDLERFSRLREEIGRSKHDFPDLARRADSLVEKAGGAVAAPPPRPAPGPTKPSAGTREPEAQPVPEKAPDPQARLNELLLRRQELGLQLETKQLQRKRRNTGGWISFGVAGASGGLAALFYYLFDVAYSEYLAADNLDDYLRFDFAAKLWRTATFAAIGTGGASLLLSSIFWLSAPATRGLEGELQTLEAEIRLLEEDLR